ncbi:MAG TPA: hypothetical protein VF549_02230 [Solirubrobacteraceae bacterium]|jgi:hypothetical protein
MRGTKGIHGRTLAAAVACAAALPATAQAGTPYVLSTPGAAAHAPDLAVDTSGNAYLAWFEPVEGPTRDRVRFCFVPAGGHACSQTSAIPIPGYEEAIAESPHVFLRAGTVVVYGQNALGGRTWRAVSGNGGASFSDPLSIGGFAARGTGFEYPSGDYGGAGPGYEGVRFQRMPVADPATDDGAGLDTTSSYNPTAALSGNREVVAWTRSASGELRYRYRVSGDPDADASWSALSAPLATGALAPDMVTTAEGARLVYVTGDRVETRLFGTTAFGPRTVIDTATADDDGFVNVDVGLAGFSDPGDPTLSSVLHAAWIDLQGGRRQARYTGSSDGGSTWSAPRTVRLDGPSSMDGIRVAGLAVGNGLVAWEEGGVVLIANLDAVAAPQEPVTEPRPEPDPTLPPDPIGPRPNPDDPGEPHDHLAPSIRRLSITPARFPRGTGAPTTGPRPSSRAAAIRFSLSEPARVTLTFARQLRGRLRRGACVRETPANRGARACKRFATIDSFTLNLPEGPQNVWFQGRTSRTRTLPLGRYRLTVAALDRAGNRATSQRTFLTIRSAS